MLLSVGVTQAQAYRVALKQHLYEQGRDAAEGTLPGGAPQARTETVTAAHLLMSASQHCNTAGNRAD